MAKKTNIIVGDESNPTKLEAGQTIINKVATKKNLDRLVEINGEGSSKTTTDGTDGGLLKGKPHYDANGKPTGGIPAVVSGGNRVELEGEEFVVSKEASKKHWRELSKINTSAGNGVPINPPAGADEDIDTDEFEKGGKIEFNPHKLPNKNILNYAIKIKEKYPKVWCLGGNIFGNEAFKNLKRVSERGYWLDSEEWMYKKWRAFVSRHKGDFRIAGVIAMLKWVDEVGKGWGYMKDLIEAEIDKKYPKNKIAGGGGVEVKFYETTTEHAKEYGIDAKKPLYLQRLYVDIEKRGQGLGEKALKEAEEYAIKHGNDVIFGHIANKSNSVKGFISKKGYVVNEQNNEFYKVISKDKMAGGGGVKATTSRFRPSETIVFNPPLVGENGNKLVSYTWAYEYTMLPNYEGELVGKRVSDWTQADESAETGRDIVHKYGIEFPDGTTKVVSSESVPILLGFQDRAQAKVFGSLATASKTLAKQEMKLAILEAQQKEFNDAKKSIIDKGFPAPEVREVESSFGKMRLFVGDGSCVIDDDGKYDKERLECAQDNYVKNRLTELGFDVYRSSKSYQIGELKKLVERQKRKIEQMLNTNKMEHGGELKKGIRIEREHIDTLTDLYKHKITPKEAIKRTAKDHLSENPNYYTELSKIETMAQGGNADSFKYPTPFGAESKLTFAQQSLVRTKAFKEWFGDWERAGKDYIKNATPDKNILTYEAYNDVSKVIDLETGEPRVMYHGTSQKDEFFEFKTEADGMRRPYGYFAFNKEYSENFIIENGGHLYNCFLNIKKPFNANSTSVFRGFRRDFSYWIVSIATALVYQEKGVSLSEEDVKKEYDKIIHEMKYGGVMDYLIKNAFPSDRGALPFWMAMSRDANGIFKKYLKGHGFDGIFYSEEIASFFDKENPAQFTDAFTIFEPNQVKLADGRNTDFDPMKMDIRYDKGGKLGNKHHAHQNFSNMDRKERLASVIFGDKFEDGGIVNKVKHEPTTAELNTVTIVKTKQEIDKEFVNNLIKKMNN